MTMTTIYHYHPETRVFCGSSVADECPRQPGVALIPAFATIVPPPTADGLIRFQPDVGAWVVDVVTEGEAVPAPAILVVAEPTAAERRAALTKIVQAHLDAQAVAMGFDSMLSAVSYGAFPSENPIEARFYAEGLALGAWRSRVWAICYAVLSAVEAGERTEPTAAELLAELPVFVLEAV